MTAKAAPTLILAMTIPATAGPTKRAELKMIALIARAEAERRPVDQGRDQREPRRLRHRVEHARAERSARTAARSRSPRCRREPPAASASMLPAICVTRMMPTRSRRSARVPASGLRNTTGKNSAIDTMPSQVAGMGQGPGEPADRHPLHPDADQRHRVAARINAVVAMGKGEGRHCRSPPGKQATEIEGQNDATTRKQQTPVRSYCLARLGANSAGAQRRAVLCQRCAVRG